MPEILLHYIWQYCLWASYPQQTTDGRSIEIISVGQHNLDAGPDFSNVHLRIGNQEWVGNVELHISSSDWYKHHHHEDPAYDTVILHVVRNADKLVYNSRGEIIAQCELQYPTNTDYLSGLIEAAHHMDMAHSVIACGNQLLQDPAMLNDGWRNYLLEKRLECKMKSINQLLDITHNSWEHAFYITLAHNFGFYTNGIPFEALAIHTPLSCLQKHKNSLFQLTAILLGQSGLLRDDTIKTDEQHQLYKEYCFLQKKFNLIPIDESIWKHGKMRPQTAPEVRIRQFAQLLHQSEFLFSQLMEALDVASMRKILTLHIDPATIDTHVISPTPIGENSIDILLINTIIPYKYAKMQRESMNGITKDIINLYERIPAENNTIIRQWRSLGQSVQSAADSQALIHLYQNYCQHKRCLNCEVGHQIFIDRQLSLF